MKCLIFLSLFFVSITCIAQHKTYTVVWDDCLLRYDTANFTFSLLKKLTPILDTVKLNSGYYKVTRKIREDDRNQWRLEDMDGRVTDYREEVFYLMPDKKTKI